jgi:TRAP-type C4-dicarboxylate transport system substrate-binding protein
MVKKSVLIMLVIILGIAFTFPGCATPSPATETKPITEEATPSAEKPEVITLRYCSRDSSTSWMAKHMLIPWIEAVESATDGRIKFEVYWSNALHSPMDAWQALQDDISDATNLAMPFWPGLAPLSDVISLPLLGLENSEMGTTVFCKLYEEFPSIREEFKDIHVLFFNAASPNMPVMAKKQVKTIEDVKGMKIRVTTGPPTDYMKAIGASPMLVPMVDVYMNIEKGVIDGVLVAFSALQSQSFCEVAPYVSHIPVYNAYAVRGMNLDVWNSLPSDIQDAINSVSGPEQSILSGKQQFDDHNKVVRSELEELGYEIIEYYPTPAELSEWKDAAKPIWVKWVQDMENAGHPEAQDILDRALELVETYRP